MVFSSAEDTAPDLGMSLYVPIGALGTKMAISDVAKQREAKLKLKEVFASAQVPTEIEVYSGALRGWCVPDRPAREGIPVYSKVDAERAREKRVDLDEWVIVFLLPEEPVDAFAGYTVAIRCEIGTAPFENNWIFKTRGK